MVNRHKLIADGKSGQPADYRHKRLKKSEGKGNNAGFGEADAWKHQPAADGNSEGIEGEAKGEQK